MTLLVQGALWVYEAVLSPGLARARKELANFPAVQKALARFEPPVTNVRLPGPPFLSICIAV